jgi:hypothetical protein
MIRLKKKNLSEHPSDNGYPTIIRINTKRIDTLN